MTFEGRYDELASLESSYSSLRYRTCGKRPLEPESWTNHRLDTKKFKASSRGIIKRLLSRCVLNPSNKQCSMLVEQMLSLKTGHQRIRFW